VFQFLVQAVSDFVDANYLEGVLGTVIDLEFQATQNFPPNAASNANAFHLNGSAFYPDYTVDKACDGANTCDIVFKIDGEPQRIRYFLMSVVHEGRPGEGRQSSWLTPDAAVKRLSWPKSQALIRKAVEVLTSRF
jgi:hypothetical protein